MKMLLYILFGICMVSLVFADEILMEQFDDFDNWASHPHWEIDEGIAHTDRNAVLVSNNVSLQNYENCTLSLIYKDGENDTRIGLRNVSFEEYEWFYLEDSNDWDTFEIFFDHEDFIVEDFNIKIQTKFENGEFYIDDINLSCYVSQNGSESSSPPSGGGGVYRPTEYKMPSIDFDSASADSIALTFSTIPLNKRDMFAMTIPPTFFSQCDERYYEFCSYAIDESPYLVNKENIIIYLLVIGGLYIFLRRKKK